ncbi:hypothetical protein BCN_P104 (plasmid) [Bacillus cereus NC7401]|nr:hypothetical protein BCN_P104 [Bacillus cereus NC7401]
MYPNSRPRSVISNESSFGKIGHVEQGNKQTLYSFIRFLQRESSLISLYSNGEFNCCF